MELTTTSRTNTPSADRPQRTEGDQGQSPPTNVIRMSRSSTPISSRTSNVPPFHLNHDEPPPPSEQESERCGSTPGLALLTQPLTLAPPIDLTPRESRSPAPQSISDLQPNPRKRSRSPCTERHQPRALSAPAVESASSSFTRFSLQWPDAPSHVPTGGLSVPMPSAGVRTQEQEQGSPGAVTSKVVEGIKFVSDLSLRRTRSPYIKWTKDEDELLAKVGCPFVFVFWKLRFIYHDFLVAGSG